MNTVLMLADISDTLGKLFLPGMIILIAIAFIVVVKVMASRYKKIPPNAVGIFYGRKYKWIDPADGKPKTRGFRIIAGGGAILWPIFEHLQLMSTAAFQPKIEENDIPNRDNVKINVKGVATCKISSAPEDLHNAAMAFLGKSDEDVEMFVRNILIGHLRSIIGKLDIDEILRQRDTFNRRVIEESTEELKRLGIQVITLVIQEVNDAHGYIDALGQKTVAEAKRDAAIKVAEATRDQEIKVAQATAETQKKTSDCQKEAAVVVANNAVQIAEAERDRDVMADTEMAKANQALGIATADQEKTLKVKQAERDAAEREAQIKVQEKEGARKQQELNATVVQVAEAEKKKAVIQAEAAKSVAVLQAEAQSESAVRRAEGEKQANVLQGEGEASKTRANLTAKAEGEAAIKRQALLAEAEGMAAMKGKVLLAEAEGTAKLAEALAKMTDAARLIMILDRLPKLIELTGEAGEKIARATFVGVAAPLGNIDSIHIVDMGGNGKGLDQFASLVPNTVAKTLATLRASGLDISELAKKAGVDISAISRMVGPLPGSSLATVPPPETPKE
ncbi:MAG: SPFH domain-containing protein [Verrucomicrobia bacterium]|nr:SPFH domain-containing protein [Verrucomicrobiota bacterium]